MSEPQVWAIIGVLSATLIAFMTATVGFLNARLTDLRREMEIRFAGVDARFAAIERELDIRFSQINSRLDALDRDVLGIATRVFGTDRD